MTSAELSKDIAGWFADAYEGRMPVQVESFDNELHIVKICGEARLSSSKASTDLYASMYINKGSVSITQDKETVTDHAPMFIDVLDIKAIDSIVFSHDFIGYIILLNHTFLKEATTEVFRRVGSELSTRHFNNPKTALNSEESENFCKTIEFLSRHIKEKNHTFQREILNTGVKLLFYELWDIETRRNDMKPRSTVNIHWDSITSHFMYLVHTHCHEHHDVTWYANKLCITPEKLTGVLKKLYGKTANVLIDETIMAEAKVFLRNPDLSIQEISEILSFADQSTFGKFFKRHSGVSPANYRKGKQ